MTTPEQRRLMAASIVDFEARRDTHGRIKVYPLPAGDGGGTLEVAGINDKYHPEACAELISLIQAGQYSKAESLAAEYIASYTDGVSTWTKLPAVESYLRDSCFNRGQTGAARILQIALGVKVDGLVGSATKSAADLAAANPHGLLNRLRDARETYERSRGRDEKSKFWKGLVNRWNLALEFAKRFLPDSQAEGLSTPQAVATESETVETVTSSLVLAQSSGTALPAVIPALRRGARGSMVAAWQSFLHGQGFKPGVIDGDFGRGTELATSEFQKASGLAEDGVAGRQTLLVAAQKGFTLIEEPADDESGSDWPSRPSFPPLVGNDARALVFGKFQYVSAPTSDNREAIRILGDWESKNIIAVPIPQLRTALGNTAPKTIRFHKLAADQLIGLWADWEKAGLLKHILTYDGGFVARFIRGSRTTLSNHAFGSAFDINAGTNPLGVRPPLKGEPGSVRELVEISNSWGFYWGGHFANRPDGMHFEIATLK